MSLFRRRAAAPATAPKEVTEPIMVPMYLDDVYAIERGHHWTFGEDRVQRQLSDLLRRFREAKSAKG